MELLYISFLCISSLIYIYLQTFFKKPKAMKNLLLLSLIALSLLSCKPEEEPDTSFSKIECMDAFTVYSVSTTSPKSYYKIDYDNSTVQLKPLNESGDELDLYTLTSSGFEYIQDRFLICGLQEDIPFEGTNYETLVYDTKTGEHVRMPYTIKSVTFGTYFDRQLDTRGDNLGYLYFISKEGVVVKTDIIKNGVLNKAPVYTEMYQADAIAYPYFFCAQESGVIYRQNGKTRLLKHSGGSELVSHNGPIWANGDGTFGYGNDNELHVLSVDESGTVKDSIYSSAYTYYASNYYGQIVTFDDMTVGVHCSSAAKEIHVLYTPEYTTSTISGAYTGTVQKISGITHYLSKEKYLYYIEDGGAEVKLVKYNLDTKTSETLISSVADKLQVLNYDVDDYTSLYFNAIDDNTGKRVIGSYSENNGIELIDSTSNVTVEKIFKVY